MKILAIDLSKFNWVVYSFDTATNRNEFETIDTQRWALEQLLNQIKPEQMQLICNTIELTNKTLLIRANKTSNLCKGD
jgi:hypothetical protein